MTGLEPVTSALPRQCATDCATSAYFVVENKTYCVLQLLGYSILIVADCQVLFIEKQSQYFVGC